MTSLLEHFLFETRNEITMLHQSSKNSDFQLYELIVLIFRCITPMSYLFLLVYFMNVALTGDWFVPENLFLFFIFFFITSWALVEALFFPYYYYLFLKIQNKEATGTHRATCQESRLHFAQRCLESIKIAGENHRMEYSKKQIENDVENERGNWYMRHILQGWFCGAEITSIKYENISIWSAWAFFGAEKSKLSPRELG